MGFFGGFSRFSAAYPRDHNKRYDHLGIYLQLVAKVTSNITPPKTNMAMENHHVNRIYTFSIGVFSIVTLAFGGVGWNY